jgi:hypothetical protein
MQGYGLLRDRDFYCTRHRSLAEVAREIHGIEGTILILSFPKIIFDSALRLGIWEERSYLGCIPIEGTREVVVHHGLGIDVLNFFMQDHFNQPNRLNNPKHDLQRAYPILKSMNF